MIHSYPWYIADWRGSEAVMSMTLEERGLYRETLDRCWEVGSLPADEVLLRRMCQVSVWEWKRSWPRVRSQFIELDGRLHHPKVDEKRPSLEAWHDGRKEAGKQGAAKRWGTKLDQTSDKSAHLSGELSPTFTPSLVEVSNEKVDIDSLKTKDKQEKNGSSANSSAIATEWPSSSSTTSTTREEPPKPPTADSAIDSCSPGGERDTEPQLELIPATGAPPTNGTLKQHQGEWFAQWWAIYWRKVSRKPAEKAFQRHVRTAERFEEIMRATNQQTGAMLSREVDHRPHGATWLNAERWKDEPSAPSRGAPSRKPTVVENVMSVIGERIAKGEKPW